MRNKLRHCLSSIDVPQCRGSIYRTGDNFIWRLIIPAERCDWRQATMGTLGLHNKTLAKVRMTGEVRGCATHVA